MIRSPNTKPLVEILEAAYRFDDSEAAWLRGVAEASRPRVDAGLGILFSCYRTEDAYAHLESTGTVGCSEDLLAFFARGDVAPQEMQNVVQAYRTRSMQTMSTFVRALPETERLFMPRLHERGCADLLVANATDPCGSGCVLFAPLPSTQQIAPRTMHRWSQIAAHIAAGRRIRQHLVGVRASSTDAEEGEAVLEPNGRLRHAVGPATQANARTALREAAIRIDRARSRLRKTDPDEALSTWHALTAGRWTLLDRFERDGRRFLVAHRNDPHAPDARALTLRERQVAGYAALGHSNKLIAYEMGLYPSSVARHLRDAAVKLGAGTRVELIRRYIELAKYDLPTAT